MNRLSSAVNFPFAPMYLFGSLNNKRLISELWQVNIRSFGHRNPLEEYQIDGCRFFISMLSATRRLTVEALLRELLLDFYTSSGNRKPDNIIIFRFTLKKKGGDDDTEEEVTVYDYFVNIRKIDLRYSGDLPCINVGKPKRPTYIPLEVVPMSFRNELHGPRQNLRHWYNSCYMRQGALAIHKAIPNLVNV
ncbi:Protein argonaute 4A [Glycine soja]